MPADRSHGARKPRHEPYSGSHSRGHASAPTRQKGQTPRRRRPGSHHDPEDDGPKSAGKLKERMRDLTRELQHKVDLPATVKQNKERELAALRTDLETVLRRKEQKQITSRYHFVRFLERQQATRGLKKAQKAAAAASADSPDRSALQDAVHEAEVSVNYTIYFPLLQPYVSLFDKKNGTHAAGFKSPMWYQIEAAMSEKELQAIRNRKADRDLQASIEKVGAMGIQSKPKEQERSESTHLRGERDPDHEDDKDAMSDGGFFEET